MTSARHVRLFRNGRNQALRIPRELEFDTELRNQLERQGTPIGPNDMLIAAPALALGLTVVTDNVRQFSRVPTLPRRES